MMQHEINSAYAHARLLLADTILWRIRVYSRFLRPDEMVKDITQYCTEILSEGRDDDCPECGSIMTAGKCPQPAKHNGGI